MIVVVVAADDRVERPEAVTTEPAIPGDWNGSDPARAPDRCRSRQYNFRRSGATFGDREAVGDRHGPGAIGPRATCEHICRVVRSSWACVLEASGGVLASWGDRPNDRWLDSFISGSPAIDGGADRLELDAVWVPLPAAAAALVVGRDDLSGSTAAHGYALRS